MAEVAGVFAASHTPVMLELRRRDSRPPNAMRCSPHFIDSARRIAASRPELLVVISDDHLHNFFLDNFPAVCIGAAESYRHAGGTLAQSRASHVARACRVRGASAERSARFGFDPSFSMELTLDHGILTPLELAGVPAKCPLVPILINCVQPPMPSMKRCMQWGTLLDERDRARSAAPSASRCSRPAASATTWRRRAWACSTTTFDFEFVRLLGERDEMRARDVTPRDHVHEAGNGAEEVRTWLVARGVAGGAPLEILFHKGIADWYTGICIAEWHVAHD